MFLPYHLALWTPSTPTGGALFALPSTAAAPAVLPAQITTAAPATAISQAVTSNPSATLLSIDVLNGTVASEQVGGSRNADGQPTDTPVDSDWAARLATEGMRRQVARDARRNQLGCGREAQRFPPQPRAARWRHCGSDPLGMQRTPTRIIDDQLFARVLDSSYRAIVRASNAGNVDIYAKSASDQLLKLKHYNGHLELDVSDYALSNDTIPERARSEFFPHSVQYSDLRLAYLDRRTALLRSVSTDQFLAADPQCKRLVGASPQQPDLPLTRIGDSYLAMPPTDWKVPRAELLKGNGANVLTVDERVYLRMNDAAGPFFIEVKGTASNDTAYSKAVDSAMEQAPPYCRMSNRFEVQSRTNWTPSSPAWQLGNEHWRGVARGLDRIEAYASQFAENLAESLADARNLALPFMTSQDRPVHGPSAHRLAERLFPSIESQLQAQAQRMLYARAVDLFETANTQIRYRAPHFWLAEAMNTMQPAAPNDASSAAQPLSFVTHSATQPNAYGGFFAEGYIYLGAQFARQSRHERLATVAALLLHLDEVNLVDYFAPISADEIGMRIADILDCKPEAMSEALQFGPFMQVAQSLDPYLARPSPTTGFCRNKEENLVVQLRDADTVVKLLMVAQQQSEDSRVRDLSVRPSAFH